MEHQGDSNGMEGLNLFSPVDSRMDEYSGATETDFEYDAIIHAYCQQEDSDGGSIGGLVSASAIRIESSKHNPPPRKAVLPERATSAVMPDKGEAFGRMASLGSRSISSAAQSRVIQYLRKTISDQSSHDGGSRTKTRQTDDIQSPSLVRKGSIWMQSIGKQRQKEADADELLKNGCLAVSGPNFDVRHALARWKEALKIAAAENDLFRQARAQSNIACVLRSIGKCNLARKYIEDGLKTTIQLIEQQFTSNSCSLWLQMAAQTLDIEIKIPSRHMGGKRVSNAAIERTATVRSNYSDASEASSDAASLNSQSRLQSGCDPLHGPPILVWLMHLLTNLGNVYFSCGDYPLAMEHYGKCVRLVDSVLEEYPLDTVLLDAIRTASAIVSETQLFGLKKSSKQFKLSYLHSEALITHVRTLSHLGLCYGALGMTDESLSHQLTARNLLLAIASCVPAMSGLLPVSQGSRMSDTTNASVDAMSLQASILANIGSSYFAAGDSGKAVEMHEQSLASCETAFHFQDKDSSFNSREQTRCNIMQARQHINLASLQLDSAKCLDSIDWLKKLENANDPASDKPPIITAGLAGFQTYAQRFWIPPDDELGIFDFAQNNSLSVRKCTQSLYDDGLGVLYQQASVFRRCHDWESLFTVWMNIASAYLQLHKPILALYYISKLAVDADEEPQEDVLEDVLRKPSVSKRHHPAILYIISQCVIDLSRSSHSNISGTIKPNKGLQSLPQKLCEKINVFLKKDLNVSIDIDLRSLKQQAPFLLMKHCERAWMRLYESRKAIPQEINMMRISSILFGSHRVSEVRQPNSVMSNRPRLAAPLDSIKQQLARIYLAMAKIAWVFATEASHSDSKSHDLWLDQGNMLLSHAIIGSLKSDPNQNTFQSHDNSPSCDLVYDVTAKLLRYMGDHMDSQSRRERDAGSSLVLGYIDANVFMLIMDFLQYMQTMDTQCNERFRNKDFILELLGIPSNMIENITESFMNAAIPLYASRIGVCESCLESMITSLGSASKLSALSGTKKLLNSYSVKFRHHRQNVAECSRVSESDSLTGLIPCVHEKCWTIRE